ncbi:MAG: type IV pilus secretin PilQ [Methylococcales symbiont of Iophon sp. n. MRB-2018]|nr:MAG: type IV pilus secretin PilQ [Methylococcales symbiont of Iophon sp. n. MRB-2018]KAF3980002.1 MAG: type IV pilus secretin PilQ [Methylococcales symbiont of Iophon sp. n. MRB-2018]
MQKNKTIRLQKISTSFGRFSFGFMILLTQISIASANEVAIIDLNFSSLTGDKVQIQLTMNGTAIAPKVFQTDNPARIALDFHGVKSALEKKMYTVNQGATNSVFVVEASGITRVVINLTEAVPFETKVVDNNVYVILKPIDVTSHPKNSNEIERVDQSITQLLPEQTIKAIDFRRGLKGEGRLLLELSSANTVVDIKQRGGKLVLNFLNTQLPDALAKSYDVSDFATPVQKVEAKKRGSGVSISITPNEGNFDYSSYQSDGLLTVDFIPLTAAEKEALLKEKFHYTGDKLSLNFQNIEVRSVLQILADFTDLNIIAADTVGGTVTLRLNDVPWDQALDLILKSNGLAKRQTGNVILVAPFSEIIKIEKEELAANKVVKQLEPLKTEYIQINYAKAEEIQMLLTGSSVVQTSSERSSQIEPAIFGGSNTTKNRVFLTEKSDTQGVLSLRGSSSVDSRTNTIIVKDTVEQLEEIRKMIKILDVPVRQVMIEARIVIADINFAQEIGVKFGVAKGDSVYKQLIPSVSADENYLVDLGASAIRAHPAGALGITLARAADYVLNLELSALENENKGEVLANPRVMTSDRELAFIKQGVQIPFTTVSQNGTQIELIDAVLELNVTPQITPDGDVIMELLIKKDAPNATGGIDRREIETLVRVSDGETVVLGGVYERNIAQEQFKIPFFGDLPGVGFLFKKNTQGDSKRELLIFVTPKIVKSSLSVR